MTKEAYKLEEVQEIVRISGIIGEKRVQMREFSRFSDYARKHPGCLEGYRYIGSMVDKYPEFLSVDREDFRGAIKNLERAQENPR